jgi:hypothetical protein
VTSTDYVQLSTLIHRLGLLAEMLNPLTVIEVAVELARIIAIPPPGDPTELLGLSDAFMTAGNDLVPLVAEVRSIAGNSLPEIWKSDAGVAAARVVTATADQLSTGQPAFATAANALTGYADKVRRLQAEHARLQHQLARAVLDPFNALANILAVIAGCLSVYQQSLEAADLVRGRLADVAGQARAAAAWQGGVSPAQAVVLADTRMDQTSTGVDNGILTPAQLRLVGQLRAALPADQRAALDALLANASTDEERAFLLKALAAGHSVDELVAFDPKIHGRPDLIARLSPIDPNQPGDAMFRYVDGDGNVQYVPIKQLDNTTCGSTAIMVARLMTDPIYAYQFTEGIPTDPQLVEDRLRTEQLRIHDTTNVLWPKPWGTTPWGLSHELSQHANELGTGYDWHLVDDTDARSAEPAMRDAVTAVDDGHPVPVLIGNEVPQHYLLLIGHSGDQLTFYDPTDASVTQVPASDFLDGHMGGVGGGLQHVQGVITPSS